MLCQLCQKRPANVHLTQIINNTKMDMYLCEQCASQQGQISFESPFSISDFFSGILNLGSQEFQIPRVPDKVCDVCGMTYEEFQKTGKLGCSNCYKLFGERLNPLLKQLHGNTVHSGKTPAKQSEQIKISNDVDRLKELLNKAIQAEEYEDAAKLRDRIKELEADKTGNNKTV